MKKNSIEIIIILTVLLFMPLSCYGLPISGMTYGDMLLVVSLILMLLFLYKEGKIKKSSTFTIQLVYLIFIILNSVLVSLIVKETNIMSLLRYLLFIIWTIVVIQINIDKKRFFDCYKVLGITFALYAIIQMLIFLLYKFVVPADPLKYVLGNSLLNYYNSSNFKYYLSGELAFRSYSVFLEPSYFAMFEMPLLLHLINIKEKKFKDVFQILIIVVAMFCGRTMTGLILSAVVIAIPFLKSILKNKKNVIYFFIFLILLSCFANTDYFRKLINLVISEDGGLGVSLNNRIKNYESILGDNMLLNIIGKGVWEDTEYLPSLGRIFVSYGIIGFIFLIILYAISYLKIEKFNKKVLLIFLLSFLGTNSLFNITSVLYFTIIYAIKGDYKNDM